LAKRAFLHRDIPHYEVFFNPDEFESPVTDQNHATVEKLNAVVDELNKLRAAENTDYDTLMPLRKKILALIAGG
jgi:hypothetical protein